MKARDSEYDETIYAIVAPGGTPAWLRVDGPPDLPATPKTFVRARVPHPSEWREVLAEFQGPKDPPLPDTTVKRFGEVVIRQFTGHPDPAYPRSNGVTSTFNLYETIASGLLKVPGRFPLSIGLYSGGMSFVENVLSQITIVHGDSTVWFYDLDKGPAFVCTLWELVKVGIAPEPHRTEFGPAVTVERQGWIKRGKKTLWLLSEHQWDNAEYPPASQDGPPFVKGVSTAAEAAQEQPQRITFVAPYRTPEWLHFAAAPDIVVPMVEVEADVLFTDDPFPEWMPLSDKAKKSYYDALSMEPKAAADIYFRAVSGRDDLERDLLDAMGVRYNGSPVWWVDLERGPVRAATVLDLHRIAVTPQPWPYDVKKKKKPTKFMWLLSLEQWETATYPPASKGGPPFVKGVSTAAERLRRRRKKG